MSTPRSNPNQLALAFFTPPVMVAQPDGAVLVKPGRPVSRLSVQQFAEAVGLDRNTVYEYKGGAALPERFIEYAGKKRIWISAEAVEFFRAHWKHQRGDG